MAVADHLHTRRSTFRVPRRSVSREKQKFIEQVEAYAVDYFTEMFGQQLPVFQK